MTEWISGEIKPTESKEYYTILECRKKIDYEGAVYFRPGEVEITIDRYNTDGDYWDVLGERENPYWELIAWAEIEQPTVPEELEPYLRSYMGNFLPRPEIYGVEGV